MKTLKLKKTDISRLARGLFLLQINNEISENDYKRITKLLLKEL